MKTVALIFLALLVAPLAARADVAAVEARAAAYASTVVGRSVAVRCTGAQEWASLAAEARFDAARVWGYVPFSGGVPADYTRLSATACAYLQAFARAADKRAVTVRCRVGTRVAFAADGTRRATAVYGECADYELVLSAVATLAHEAVHLRGFRDEGLAECFAAQLFAGAAAWLGAGDVLSRRMAADYWQRVYRKLAAPYVRADCVDGSALDLSPGSASWPSGAGALVLPAP